MADSSTILTLNFRKALDWLVKQGKTELEQQGHKATGKAVNSLRYQLRTRNKMPVLGQILVVDYAVILDSGVRASNVPYSNTPRGRGGTSLFIENLIEWAGIVRPSFTQNEKKGFAFAVATNASREGFPTSGSSSFSNNGRRTGWIKHGLEIPSKSQKFKQLLDMDEYFRALLRESLNEVIKGIKVGT